MIKEEINANDTQEHKDMALQMAVKAVNDTAGVMGWARIYGAGCLTGYDGIVPTLLVFDTFPRISELDPPSPSIAKRVAALKKAIIEVSKLRASRLVKDALRTRNGPITKDIPLGSDVVIWQKHEKNWTAPYTLIAINEKTATIQFLHRKSQRLIPSLAIYKNFDIFTRDISQAYTQSKSQLLRDFYVRPSTELDLPTNTILKVLRPLYGVPEAGTHWFHTYHNHRLQKLNLKSSSYDPCLMFNSEAIVGLQTDDTITACTHSFKLKEEDELLKVKFGAKPVQILTQNRPLIFNGALISKSDTTIIVSLHDQIAKIAQVKNNCLHDFVSQRARGAYVSSVYQPQVIENPSRGLKFVKLIGKLRIIVFTDSSFASNPDFSSQLGYFIFLVDEDNNYNVIHWSSINFKRITKSVIASELYVMCYGFDIACILKNTIDNILDNKVPIIVCIDSLPFFECLVKLGNTRGKQLMIDITALRQVYEPREIAEVIWIMGETNPADALTKHAGNRALQQIVDTNKVALKPGAWVERCDTH
ncbi:hypothetical protein EV44_g3284 [Erysiphe necator]|uniref:Uncharacterized protein n=1 Tax=Uncinula necator TaxID=52586 RepID=A0A0B1PBP6_UNCNE|nr:hypothetical protein EV44_g3284 [Erysiphe necator]